MTRLAERLRWPWGSAGHDPARGPGAGLGLVRKGTGALPALRRWRAPSPGVARFKCGLAGHIVRSGPLWLFRRSRMLRMAAWTYLALK